MFRGVHVWKHHHQPVPTGLGYVALVAVNAIEETGEVFLYHEIGCLAHIFAQLRVTAYVDEKRRHILIGLFELGRFRILLEFLLYRLGNEPRKIFLSSHQFFELEIDSSLQTQ